VAARSSAAVFVAMIGLPCRGLGLSIRIIALRKKKSRKKRKLVNEWDNTTL